MSKRNKVALANYFTNKIGEAQYFYIDLFSPRGFEFLPPCVQSTKIKTYISVY